MINFKTKLATALLTAFIATATAGTQTALADNYGTLPPGCSVSPVAPRLSGAKIRYAASGYCNKNIKLFVVRLVHNYDVLPDALVRELVQSPAARPNYSLSGTTCDNGGTTQYYTEAGYYISTGDAMRTSATRTLTHC